MAGGLLPQPKQLVQDNAWNPGIAYQLYTYEPASLTPKATYQDGALATPNTNPVVANARGEVVMYGSGSYRVILKDSLGNTIWDRDNIDALIGGTSLAGSGGAAQVGYDDSTLDVVLKSRLGRVVGSVSALRSLNKTKNTQAYVTGYYAPGDGGGGAYYYDAADTTTADNAGTIIVAADGGRWKMANPTQATVKTFGAKGNCTAFGVGTDDLNAFNACRDWANAGGYSMVIPAGRYRLSGPLTISNTANNNGTFSEFRTNLIGFGPRESQLWFDNGNFNGVVINGTTTGSGATSFQSVKGLAILKTDRQGTGLFLNAHSHISVEDVHLMGWTYGHYGIDILSSKYADMVIQYNNYGAYWQRGTLSLPNAIILQNVAVGQNANWGIYVDTPATFSFIGGSVESNGSGGTDPAKWGARILTQAAPDGTVSAIFSGVYFENNVGLSAGVLGSADLHIINNAADTAAIVTGCSFGRHSAYALNCIRYESSGGFKNKLTLLGNGFRGYSDYTASASRRYVGIGDPTDTIQVIDLGNTYSDVLEAPDFNYPYVTPQSVASAWCRFDGTQAGPTITPTIAQNVASITKNGTGDYTINYRRPLATANNAYDFGMVNLVGLMAVITETTSSVRIKTVNIGGTSTDFVMSFGVKGGMNFA